MLTDKLTEVKRRQEFEDIDQIVNKTKLKDLKLKIRAEPAMDTSQQTIRRAISPKNFFLSKRGVLGNSKSAAKLTNTLNSTERYLKPIASTKRSLLYSDPAKSSHRLNKSTTSTLYSEGQLSANKDSSRTTEQILSGKAKEESGKKTSLVYMNTFSSIVERSKTKQAYKVIGSKKIAL